MDDLTVELGNLFRDEMDRTINRIANEKMIDKNELQDHYLKPKKYFIEKINDTILNRTKKPNKRILPSNEQCVGRKMDFTQCTRKRKDNTEFCGSHIKNRPNGKIGDDGSCFNKKKGTRGRKRKNLNDNVGENEILTTKKYIGNELYLMDSNNVIYTYNQEFPVILGLYNEKTDKIEKMD